MSEALRQFHFLQPWWLLALLAMPLPLWLAARDDTATRALSRLVDADLLPHLLQGRPRGRRVSSGLLALGWLLGVLALAGPTWSRVAQPLYVDRAAQVVAISLSQRMLARDVAPSRIDRARYKAHDLLNVNRDGLNALIGYAGESFVVAPLTSDAHSLADLLDAMAPDTMPVDGDDAAAAIAQGAALIRDAKAGGGSLVLITDDADATAQTAARKARAEGVRVSVLGVGAPQGGPVPQGDGGFLHDAHGNLVLAQRDDAALAALAMAGGGRYVPMRDDGGDIAALKSELRPAQHAAVAAGQRGDAWQDRGPWLLLPLLLIVALAFRRGWLLLLPLVLLPMWPTTAHASGWRDWWQRPDQQAARALREGHAKQAQQLARDPALRGAAAYRAGDYAAAAQALREAGGADAPYNLGNALAKQGQYPEAIKAYDHALQLNPHNDDARVNRKAVEDAMREQQQQEKQQQPSSKSAQDKNGQGGKNGQGDSTDGKHSHDNPPSSPDNGQSDGKSQDKDSPGVTQDQSTQARQDQRAAGDKNQPSPQQQAAQQAQAAKAQQALRQQMDQALARGQRSATKPPTHELGITDADDPLSKLPSDVRQTLQRVPDDPGALLRRKFELEYRERHGGRQAEDGQP